MREILGSGVDFLNRFGQPFCDFAGTMLVQTTILVVVLLAIELLVRNRVRAVVRYCLWLLVLVKLVLPVSLHTPASLAYWLPTQRPDASSPVTETAADRSASPAFAPIDRRPDETNAHRQAELIPADVQTKSEAAGRTPLATPTVAPVAEVPKLNIRGGLFALWLLGVVVLLALVARRAVWVRRLVKQAAPASNELQEQLADSLSALGLSHCHASSPSPLKGEGQLAVSLSNGGEGEGEDASKRHSVSIKISDRLGSPAICGLWRPTILLPRGFPAGLDREQVRMVFLHELIHWRRGDLVVNCIQTLLQIVYFYNPAVWLANLIIRRLREQAVDETVLVVVVQPSRLLRGRDARTTNLLAETRGQSERYASTLLDIAAAPLRPLEATLRLTGVVESRSALAARIRHIIARPIPRTAKLGFIGFATVALSGLVLLPMDRPQGVARANDEPMTKLSDAQPPLAAEKGKDIDGDPLPPGAIARLGSKRFRSSSAPAAMAYTADGKTLVQIVQGASFGRLQHWNPNTGRLLGETRFTDYGSPNAAAIAPAANVFAATWWTVDDANNVTSFIGVFDLASGNRKTQMRIAGRPVEKLALSPNGKTIAYYGRGKPYVVDVSTQKEVFSGEASRERVDSLTFSPDGATLAIGCDGKMLISKWAAKGRPLEIAFPHDARISPRGVDAVAFSPDGTTIAAGSNDAGPEGPSLIDAASGKTLRTYPVPGVTRWYFRTLQFSPDGKMLSTNIDDNSGNGVALWDVATGKLIYRLFGLFGDAYYLSFSPDNRQLAASSYWYSTMCVWDLETGRPRSDGPPTHEQPPNTIRFLPGDKRLVTAGDDYTIGVWNISDSRQERFMRHVRWPGTYDSAIRGMDVSPDGKYIISSSFDDTVRMWDTDSGREVYRLPSHGHYGGHREVRFTPDSKRFASWGDDMRVYEWDVATGKAVSEFLAYPAGLSVEPDRLGNPPFSGPDGGPQIGSARFSDDASVLYLALNGIRRFSVATEKELPNIDVPADNFNGGWIAVSPDNRYLIWNRGGKPEKVTMPDGTSRNVWKSHPVELRSLPDGNAVTKLQLPGEWSDCIAFSPDSRTVAMAIIDQPYRIELRTIPDLSEVARIELPSRAHAVEFSHSGRLLAVSLFDSTVLVWDLEHLPPAGKP
jgi:WD40 repeat protein/beta-lactamase regulating signal transducer with metallopeptidase domain